MTTTAIEYSRRTLSRDIERAAKFLGTASRSPSVWRILQTQAGYTQAAHDEGWSLYLKVLGYKRSGGQPTAVAPGEQDRAIAALDAWDGPAFSRARAALQRLFPAQHDYI